MHRQLNEPLIWKAVIFSGLMCAIFWHIFSSLGQSPLPVVGDDARHFVVWLRQLSNPEFFSSDPIAEYFRALTPALYTALFWPAAQLGIDVLPWHYLIVTPLACLLLVVSSYKILSHILAATEVDVGFATFLLCTLFSVYAVEGLPRTFAVSIIFFALSYFIERNRILLAIVMFFGACIYPAAVILAGFIIACYSLISIKSSVSDLAGDIKLVGFAGVSGILGLAIFLYGTADIGPTMLVAEARDLAIFADGSRTSFFRENIVNQIFCSGRGGVLPICTGGKGYFAAMAALTLSVGVFIAGYHSFKYLSKNGNVKQRNTTMQLLLAMVMAGLFLYILAHLIAFRAHLPARYSQYSIGLVFNFSIIVILVAAIAFVLDDRPEWASALLKKSSKMMIFLVAWFVIVVVTILNSKQAKDEEPLISQYLRQTPMNSVVAGFGKYIDNVPAFTNRPAYVAMELLIPYKRNYYDKMAKRVAILKQLYTLPLEAEFAKILDDSGIDYFLIPTNWNFGYYRWVRSFPELMQITENNTFSQRSPSIIGCTIVNGRRYNLIDADCLQKVAMSH